MPGVTVGSGLAPAATRRSEPGRRKRRPYTAAGYRSPQSRHAWGAQAPLGSGDRPDFLHHVLGLKYLLPVFLEQVLLSSRDRFLGAVG